MPGLLIEPDDVCLYVTEACNSNCIMCPMSDAARKRGSSIEEKKWTALAEQIPADAEHLTITGGEPFLTHQHLLPVIARIHDTHPFLPVLILSNGRALSLSSIQERLRPLISPMDHYAIPIHAEEAGLHDSITQSPGSFAQTWKGIQFLSSTDAQVEIRIVAHRHNLAHLSDIFASIVKSKCRISEINLIAMEMTGSAAKNRNDLWVDYTSVYQHASAGIRYAVEHEIDVGLYNFPLCTLPREAWPLSKNSISSWKVRYNPDCENCSVLHACGGLFYSVQELKLCETKPFVEECEK